VCKCLLRVIQCGSEVELEVEASAFEGEVAESQEGEAAEARDFLVVGAEVGETSVGKFVEPLVAEVVFEVEAEVTSEGEVVVAFEEAEVVHAGEEDEVVAKAGADRVAVGGDKVEEALVGVAEAVATFAVEGAGISVDEAVEVSEDKVEV